MKKSRKKIMVTVVSALATLLLGMVVIYVIDEIPEEPRDDEAVIPRSVGDISHQDAAALVLRWIDSQRSDKGVYYLQERCLDDSCTPYIDNRSGFFAILARLTYFRSFPSDEHLDLIERDLDVYRDLDAIPDLQNYYWNCAIMLDIAQDKEIPLSIRSKAEKICGVGMYTPSVLDEVESMLSDDPTSGELDPSVVSELRNIDHTELFVGDLDWKMYNFAAYASDFVARYEMYGYEEDKNLAKGLIALALEYYLREIEEGRAIDPQTSCILSVSALDGYLMTEKPVYLDVSSSLVTATDVQKKDLFDEAYCLYAKTRLSEDSDYDDPELESRIDLAVETWFDYPGYEGYYGGEGVFSQNNVAELLRPLPENSLMLYVLLHAK